MALMGALACTAAAHAIDETTPDDRLVIGGKTFRLRLMLGTGRGRSAHVRMGVEADREAFLAGRVPVLSSDSAGSPLEGVVR